MKKKTYRKLLLLTQAAEDAQAALEAFKKRCAEEASIQPSDIIQVEGPHHNGRQMRVERVSVKLKYDGGAEWVASGRVLKKNGEDSQYMGWSLHECNLIDDV